MMSLISLAVSVLLTLLISAATPAACGVAPEVPLMSVM